MAHLDEQSPQDMVTTSWIRQMIQKRESGMFAILTVSVIIMSLVRPDTFFTSENLFNITKQISIITIVAVGQSFYPDDWWD